MTITEIIEKYEIPEQFYPALEEVYKKGLDDMMQGAIDILTLNFIGDINELAEQIIKTAKQKPNDIRPSRT